jgi:hypothetical protein
VDVRRARRQLQLVLTRHARIVLGLRGRGNVDRADALRFLDRFLGPRSGVDVIGGRARGEEIHRHHRELEAGAALQEQHLVVRRNGRQRADVGLRLREDRLERRRAVADLEDRHADSRQRHEIALNLFENGHRQDRGPRREVVDAMNGSHGRSGQPRRREDTKIKIASCLRAFVAIKS